MANLERCFPNSPRTALGNKIGQHTVWGASGCRNAAARWCTRPACRWPRPSRPGSSVRPTRTSSCRWSADHSSLRTDSPIALCASCRSKLLNCNGLDRLSRNLNGEGGIRTPGPLSETQHFQCCTIGHSATSPDALISSGNRRHLGMGGADMRSLADRDGTATGGGSPGPCSGHSSPSVCSRCNRQGLPGGLAVSR